MVFGKTLVAWLCPRLSQNCYFHFLQYPLSAYLHHLLLAFSQSWFWYGGNHTYLTVFTFIHGGLLVPLAVILSQIFLDNNLTVALGCEHCHHYRTPFLLKLSASAQLHWVHDNLVLWCPWNTGLCHPVTFCNTPKLILTNPNHPQCYGTQSTSRPTPKNTEPTLVTPPALRSHLACPSDSKNDLVDPGLNTNRLPRHRCH